MNEASIVDYAIVILLVLLMIAAVFRRERASGAANPVGTKKLSDELHSVDKRVKSVEKEVEIIQRQLGDVATTADIHAIQQQIKGNAELAKRSEQGIERIERILLEKAFK